MLALFFLSGISGLVYQIVWTRMLVLVFGNTLLATSTVLSAFMAGLAAGSYLFGQYIDRRSRPLIKVYALLEAGIGVYALGFPLLLAMVEPIYANLHISLEGNINLLNLIRFGTCFGMIFLPTCFMGATLPVLVKRFVQGSESLGRQVGFLYGLNTVGAVAGCLAAGFLLLRTLGMWRTTVVAVAINLIVAGIAWRLARDEVPGESIRKGGGSPPEEKDQAVPARNPSAIRMVLIGIGLSGFCALAYEILWARMLNLFLQNNVYSFTAILATFLSGIALGSLAYSKYLSRVRHPVRLFMLLEVGIGLLAYATPHLFNLLNETLFLKRGESLTLAKTAVIMIAPTVLMGIAVPLAMQICQRGVRREGSSVGNVYAVNTVGSILGAFAAGFVLIPTIGLHQGLIVVASLNILAGFLAFLPTISWSRKLLASLVFGVILLLMFLWSPDSLFRDLYEKAQPDARILHYEEGKVANVVVYDFFKDGYKDLFLNRVEEASSRLWHVQVFKLLGILPMLVHQEPRTALMVAFGAGMSAGASIDHAQSLDCVDLNPDIDEVAEIFKKENLDVLHNTKLNRIVNDGRNALLLNPQRYSVIISDATNPKMFDSWTLYTKEFYELVKSRLAPNGIFAQWILIPLPGDAIQVLLKTFKSVFPHTSFWCVYGSSQCLMLGTPDRLEIDYQTFSAKLTPILVSSGFQDYGVGSTEKLLSFLMLGEDELEQALQGTTRINTDDLPYAQFRVTGDIQGVRASLDLLNYQGSAMPYLTNLGGEERRVEQELDDFVEISRRLSLGFLLVSPKEYRAAAAVAMEAGKENDENVKFALGYDQERKRYFERRVADYPDDANAHHSLGYIYWKERRYDAAIERLQKAISLKKDFGNAYFNLARTYMDAGRYSEAVSRLMEVRELNPALGMLRQVENQLAIVRILRKRHYEGPSASRSMELAEAYMRDGDLVQATWAARAAATQSENHVPIHLQLAGLYENLELVDRALQTYQKLAFLSPRDKSIQEKLAQFQLLQTDRAAKQRWLSSREVVFEEERRRDDHPESCQAAIRAWNTYDFDSSITPTKLREASALFEETIEEEPTHMHAYVDLALILELLGDPDRAATIWRRGLQVSPGNPAAEGAIKRLELLEELDRSGLETRKQAEILGEIGRLHYLEGEFERALQYLRRAVERDPGNGGLWVTMGASYQGTGAYEEAYEAYGRALGLEPDVTTAASITKRLAKIQGLLTRSAGLEASPTQ